MECLRFALLFNGSTLEPWHLRCLDHLAESAKLTGLILAVDSPHSPARASGTALMRLYTRSVSNGSVDVTKRFANMRRFYGAESVEPPDLDFVLKLGRGSIPPGMGLAARHGIWCFQHEIEGDLLPFFREVYDAEDVTEAALLALGGSGGTAAILELGRFRTEKRSYIENRDRVLESVAEWPAHVCRRLAREAGDPARRTPRTMRPDRPAFCPHILRFWARIARRRLKVASERLFRHPQWNIGTLPGRSSLLPPLPFPA